MTAIGLSNSTQVELGKWTPAAMHAMLHLEMNLNHWSIFENFTLYLFFFFFFYGNKFSA